MLLIFMSSLGWSGQLEEQAASSNLQLPSSQNASVSNQHSRYAADLTKDTLIKQLKKEYKDIQFFEADFVQKTKQMGMEIEQSGHLYTAKPKNIRWEFKTPTEQLFVSDGSSQWTYNPIMNQAIHSTDLSSHPASGLLNDLSSIEEHFSIELAAQTDKDVEVNIVPHNEGLSQQFDSMKITLTKDPLQIQEVYLKDTMGGEFVLSLSNIKLDRGAEKLSDEAQKARASLFLFVPPEGTDVIKADTFTQ